MHTLTLTISRKNEGAVRSFLRKYGFPYELHRRSVSRFHVDCVEADFYLLETIERKFEA